MHAVAHVAEGADGDADGLVLVFEVGVLEHGVHRGRVLAGQRGDGEEVGVEDEDGPPAITDIMQILAFFHVKTEDPTRQAPQPN